MPRVQCSQCRYSWIFTSRVHSHKLKKSYWVRCPKCRSKLFQRKKNKVWEPMKVEAEKAI